METNKYTPYCSIMFFYRNTRKQTARWCKDVLRSLYDWNRVMQLNHCTVWSCSWPHQMKGHICHWHCDVLWHLADWHFTGTLDLLSLRQRDIREDIYSIVPRTLHNVSFTREDLKYWQYNMLLGQSVCSAKFLFF